MVKSLADPQFTVALNDISNLVDRVGHYTFLNYSAKYTSNNSAAYDNKLSVADNVCSVLEGLGMDHFRKFLPEEEINAFTKNLYEQKKQYIELLSNDPARQEKLNQKIGLINATFKGFRIKEYTEAIEKNIADKEQQQVAISAVKQAMLEVTVDKKDYITELQNKTVDILKKSKKYDMQTIDKIARYITPAHPEKEFIQNFVKKTYEEAIANTTNVMEERNNAVNALKQALQEVPINQTNYIKNYIKELHSKTAEILQTTPKYSSESIKAITNHIETSATDNKFDPTEFLKKYKEAVEKDVNQKTNSVQKQDAVLAITQAMMEVPSNLKQEAYIQALQNKTAEVLNSMKKYKYDEKLTAPILSINPPSEFTETQRTALSQAATKEAQQISEIFKSPSSIDPHINNMHKKRMLMRTNLGEEKRKELDEKLEAIKPLWECNERNYSNPKKSAYLGAPTKIDDEVGVKEAFHTFTKDLASKTAPEDLAKVMPTISATAPSIVGSIIATQCTEKLVNQTKLNLAPQVQDKIFNKLEKELSTLDPDFLGKNSTKIITQISTSLNNNKSFLSYFTGKYDISTSKLDRIIQETRQEEKKAKNPSNQQVSSNSFQKASLAAQQALGASAAAPLPPHAPARSPTPVLPTSPHKENHWQDVKHMETTINSTNAINTAQSKPIAIPQPHKKPEELDVPNHVPKNIIAANSTESLPKKLSEAWGITNNTTTAPKVKPSPTPPVSNQRRKSSHSFDI